MITLITKRCSFESRRGHNHGDMGSEPDPTVRHRLRLQNHRGEAVLRADKPKGPLVERNGGPSLQGQDLPAQDRLHAVRCFQRNGAFHRVDRPARRAHGHVLRTRLRSGRRRRRGGVRSDHESRENDKLV